MTEAPDPIERYLERLAARLEALGPVESGEVVAEVRAHLAEAVADAEGDVGAALARFGSAEALAAQVLEERGVLSGGSAAPSAPAWLRALALAADLLLWLAALDLFLVPLGLLAYIVVPAPRTVVLATLALVVVASGGWLLSRWRRTGHATIGMRCMGLRRVRVGETTRFVRRRDIPGLPRDNRMWPIAVVALAVIALASVVSSGAATVTISSPQRIQSQIAAAIGDATTGQGMVNDLYTGVIGGAGVEGLGGLFEPTSLGEVTALVGRRAAGELDNYVIRDVALGDYDERLSDWPSETTQTTIVLVTVDEIPKDPPPDSTPVAYRWKVVCAMTGTGDGSMSGQWVIESAERLSE